MKKKILCLAMMMVMVVGTGMTAFAEDYQGKDGWQVEYDGNQMKSNFVTADLQDDAKDIQPNDSLELKIALKNSSTDKTDWYMTNTILQTLEEAKAGASGGAYEYRLTYLNAAGTETVLFDSERVGGEGTSQSGEGLHQATDSLKDYFYIDRLDKGQSGSVHLRIKVEGESQGNGYQDTLAKLQMNFAVEKVVSKTETVKKVITNTVKTGDTSKALLFCALALVSGIVLLGLGIHSMKKRKGNSKKGE